MSWPIQKIQQVLTELAMPFSREAKFPTLRSDKNWLLRFDFVVYIEEEAIGDRVYPRDTSGKAVMCVIEFDGIQHFESTQVFGGDKAFEEGKRRDEIKNQFCVDNNIPLLRLRPEDDIAIAVDKFTDYAFQLDTDTYYICNAKRSSTGSSKNISM
jgi:hypothetical protein